MESNFPNLTTSALPIEFFKHSLTKQPTVAFDYCANYTSAYMNSKGVNSVYL